MSDSADAQAMEAALAYDRWFDRDWGRYSSHAERRAIRHAVGSTAGQRVVDVGCGTGRFAGSLDHGAGMLVGLDRDPAMLSIARTRATGPLLAADALALPFGDESFDLTVAITVLEFVADPSAAAGELARVTRRGGRFVIGALNIRSPWGLAHRREFGDPPWNAARFLTRQELESLGARYGAISVTGALHAPGPFPGMRIVGPALEFIGRAVPTFGAFQVLVVERS